MLNNIITLTTDFGLDDHFVGTVKGVILSINPKVKIIDICHTIKPQDIESGAFLLLCSYKYFPKGTIHLVVVDPHVGTKRKIILVKTEKYFFLAPDNGILSFVLQKEKIKKIINVSCRKYFLKNISQTFAARDIFAPVAGYLSKGVNINKFGDEIKNFKKIKYPMPEVNKNEIIGEVIYIDHFGNLITNIPEEMIKNKEIKIKVKNFLIGKLSSCYEEGEKGKPLAILGSTGFLEIATNCNSAKNLLKIKKKDMIKIKIIFKK